jgi:hypothetical protein
MAVRKKKQRKSREAFVHYIVAIEGWDWSYSLSLNQEKMWSSLMESTGNVLWPSGLRQ